MPSSRKKAEFPAMNGLAVALSGLFVLELIFTLGSRDVPEQHFPPGIAREAGSQPDGLADPSQSTLLAWRGVVLGRPLFDPSRRPPSAPSQAPAIPVEIPRLSGIMITPTEKIAVFVPAMGDPIIVSENSPLGPFTILAITEDSVTIKGPNGITVLRSDFSYRGKSGNTPTAKNILAGGIDLTLIKVPLPSAAAWPGPPQIH